MKNCSKCLKQRDLSDFYFRKDLANYRNECKFCFVKKEQLNRELRKNRTEINYRLNKRCNKCSSLKDASEFGKARVNPDGLKSVCKPCEAKKSWTYVASKEGLAAKRIKKRKYLIKRATPKWADTKAIYSIHKLVRLKNIGKNKSEYYSVDHVIPLSNENVSGLHVIENLQVILLKDNFAKRNKWELSQGVGLCSY